MQILLRTFFVVILLVAAAGAADCWPQFRGPSGNGSSAATNVPLRWSETNNIAWESRVPGRGRSSPVVLGDRLWVTTALEQGVKRMRIGPDDMQTAEGVTLKVICLDRADGKIVWEKTLFEVDKPDPVHWLNSWATPTPVAEPGRLYCDFGTYGTACLDAKTGNVLWQRRLPLDHQVGPGSSPVVWRNLLMLVRDGRDAQYVTALDKASGETVWKVDRPPLKARVGELKKSFVTPLMVEHNGRPQLVSPGPQWVVSYEPATGREIWRARHGEGFSIGSCPVAGQGMVFFSTGCFKAQLCAIRLDGQGDVAETHVAWKSLRQVPVMSSPVLVGEEIYYVSDDGMATCADVRTGQPLWQERLGGGHLASPIAVEGRIYFFGQEGKTTVIKAAKQFEKLAENLLPGPLIATPAVVDGTIFLRTDSRLYRIGGK